MAMKKKSAKQAAGKKVAAKKATSVSAEPKMTKAAFIRSLPADMPAADVIAKGEKAGLKLDAMAVYKTRSNARKAKGKMKSPAGRKAAPKASTGPQARGKAPDKKNRVLEVVAQNPSWSAEEVATAAKCSVTYVYSVWRSKPDTGLKRRALPAATNGGVAEFYRVLKRLGVDKAKELIANIEAFQNA